MLNLMRDGMTCGKVFVVWWEGGKDMKQAETESTGFADPLKNPGVEDGRATQVRGLGLSG